MNPEVLEFEESTLRVEGPVAVFTHQRPQTRHALTAALRQDYVRMLAHVSDHRGIRALIITGSGGAFCAGGDAKFMHERMQSTDRWVNSPDAMRRRLLQVQRWLTQLRDLDIPVIAAVDGPAYGGGFSLALQSDFVLASTRASFCMAFARIGLVPDYGAAYTLPRIVGLSRAKELMMTARRVGATEGQLLGFVHEIHEPDALLPAAHAMAHKLAKGPREAVAMTKSMLNKSFETDYATLSALEACAQGVAFDSAYHADTVARFSRGEPGLYDWDKA